MTTVEDVARLAPHSFLEVYALDLEDNVSLIPVCDFTSDNWSKWFVDHRDYEVLRIDVSEIAYNYHVPVLRVFIAKEDFSDD